MVSDKSNSDLVRHLKDKCYHQKRELRSLNRSIRVAQMTMAEAVRARHSLWNQLIAERKKQQLTDYRSVCQCWSCRLREWWRFRSGQTYPGRPGWRFPWAHR